MGKPRSKEKERPKTRPIAAAIETWLADGATAAQVSEAQLVGSDELIAQAPKRWVIYEPMVLLPSGSFTTGVWRRVLAEGEARTLWEEILRQISAIAVASGTNRLSHLAVNEGIPLLLVDESTSAAHTDGDALEVNEDGTASPSDLKKENILRSPSGLRMLYGDFGPGQLNGRDGDDHELADRDFEEALWVSTRQNGIFQTWAPRWTMFSRGNVKEKSRLLDFHKRAAVNGLEQEGSLELSHRVLNGKDIKNKWAVDLYSGIGYFTFSYAKLGLRVLCWELNPWSVEALRRGAQTNGWSVKVVTGDALRLPTTDIVTDDIQIVVFQEDNIRSAARMAELRNSGHTLEVLHVNCGLLPSSSETWRPSLDILGGSGHGWLHLHENVSVTEIEGRRQGIQEMFDTWVASEPRGEEDRQVSVEHVERVKTFAPDVWHCVFDVYIGSPSRALYDGIT